MYLLFVVKICITIQKFSYLIVFCFVSNKILSLTHEFVAFTRFHGLSSSLTNREEMMIVAVSFPNRVASLNYFSNTIIVIRFIYAVSSPFFLKKSTV